MVLIYTDDPFPAYAPTGFRQFKLCPNHRTVQQIPPPACGCTFNFSNHFLKPGVPILRGNPGHFWKDTDGGNLPVLSTHSLGMPYFNPPRKTCANVYYGDRKLDFVRSLYSNINEFGYGQWGDEDVNYNSDTYAKGFGV